MRGRRRREINSRGGADHRGDHDPGVVAPERAVEESVQAGRDGGGAQAQRGAHLARLDQEVRRRAAALLVHPGGGEAVDPVVDEHLAEDRVVTAPVDIGPVVRRYGGDRGHEAQRDEHHHDSGESDVTEAPEKGGGGRRHEVHAEERGHDQPGLEHLGLKGQAHPDTGQDQRPDLSRHEGFRGGIGRQHEEQNQERVRNIAPVEEDRDRADGQDECSRQARAGPGHAADGPVQDEHGQCALEDLGQHDGPQVKAEQSQRECLHPQRARQLVHRDGAPRVEGAEDEVVPTGRHAAGGGAVEGLEIHVPDAPGVSRGGQRGHGQESGPGPARLVGW